MPRRREILAVAALLVLATPLAAQQYPSQAGGSLQKFQRSNGVVDTFEIDASSDQAQVFLYDADDERLATYDCFPGICASPGWELRTTIRGLGGQVLREYRSGPGGWRWQRDYVYRGSQLLAAEEADGQGGSDAFHFHLDHLGTPRQITNGAGVQVALHSYYPFGQEATNPSQTPFGKRFTGHERDDNGAGNVGDLDYMHARFCSPTLGRFLSFDPIGGNPRNPQSWNRYAYALNNPLNFTDPDGLFAALFLDLYFVAFDEITVRSRFDLLEFDDLINLDSILGFKEEFGFQRRTTDDLRYSARRGGEQEASALDQQYGLGDDIILETALFLAGGAGQGVFKFGVIGITKVVGSSISKATFKIGPKIVKQMGARGWTREMINEAVGLGRRISALNKANGNPASRYLHPRTGQSVVIDDVTGDIIHVGGPGFKYGPESGDVP